MRRVPNTSAQLVLHFGGQDMTYFTPRIRLSARVRRCSWTKLAAIAAMTLTAALASAQFRGSIQGTVTDPQGAVIPGATLTLTDLSTNHKWTANSNGEGIYYL